VASRAGSAPPQVCGSDQRIGAPVTGAIGETVGGGDAGGDIGGEAGGAAGGVAGGDAGGTAGGAAGGGAGAAPAGGGAVDAGAGGPGVSPPLQATSAAASVAISRRLMAALSTASPDPSPRC
jgi:hypothetical protein